MSPRPRTAEAHAPEAAAPEASAPEGGFTNRPVKTIRAGHGVKMDIWENRGENGSFHTASITRSWKDDKEQWHDQKTHEPERRRTPRSCSRRPEDRGQSR
jgi:hypothetical protein